MLQSPFENSTVLRLKIILKLLKFSKWRPDFFVLLRIGRKIGRKHWGHSQSIKQTDCHNKAHSQSELLKELPHNSRKKSNWTEHRNHSERCRNHGKCHFLGAYERSQCRRFSHLLMSKNVFAHN